MQHDSRIFVAGGETLIGAALLRRLNLEGYLNLVGTYDDQPDLTSESAVAAFFDEYEPEYVFLAAGKSGGIRENDRHPATLMLDNLLVQTNVIRQAHECGTQKLVYLASSCSYPKHSKQPMAVDSLMTGPLEPTNDAYATAKIAGIKLCQAYGREHGRNFITTIPANGFGLEDDFTPESGHVIPALIARMHQAKRNNADAVKIWGTGKPQREFLFADDIADACIFVMSEYDDSQIPINLGGGDILSIAETAEAIKLVVGFEGDLLFDTTKPDGMPLKGLDSRPLQSLGWQPRTPFTEALAQTYDAYLEQLHPTRIRMPLSAAG